MGSTSKRFKGGRKWPHTGLVSWRHMNIGGGLDSYVLMMYGLYYHFNRLSPSPLSLPSLPPLSPSPLSLPLQVASHRVCTSVE